MTLEIWVQLLGYVTGLVCGNWFVPQIPLTAIIKKLQASMGSLARVELTYVDLISYLKEERRTIYGTFLNGDNVYQTDLESEAVIILGNEANGISDNVSAAVDKKFNHPSIWSTATY